MLFASLFFGLPGVERKSAPKTLNSKNQPIKTTERQ